MKACIRGSIFTFTVCLSPEHSPLTSDGDPIVFSEQFLWGSYQMCVGVESCSLYSGLTPRTCVNTMQALQCVCVWAQFGTFVCFCPSVKPVFHSSSVSQSHRGNKTSCVESAHFPWKKKRTHTCTCMQTSIGVWSEKVVINTWGVLVQPQLCHRVFTELRF